MNPNAVLVLASATTFVAVYLLVRHGIAPAKAAFARTERTYDLVLNHQLLMQTNARHAVWATLAFAAIVAVFVSLITASPFWGLVSFAALLFFPMMVFKHLREKRRQKLETQLVDGLTTLASAARAGLNLVQSFQLLVTNSTGPIQQEFAQLVREYEMGIDLNQAMRNAANRIESQTYRLTFTAIEMHRTRGGDTAQSMDRIAESIREIQRLDGKLDALTAQGRSQATMMAVMPFVFLVILYLIEPQGVTLLFTTTPGRLLLLGVAGLILLGFLWIRKILAVDL